MKPKLTILCDVTFLAVSSIFFRMLYLRMCSKNKKKRADRNLRLGGRCFYMFFQLSPYIFINFNVKLHPLTLIAAPSPEIRRTWKRNFLSFLLKPKLNKYSNFFLWLEITLNCSLLQISQLISIALKDYYSSTMEDSEYGRIGKKASVPGRSRIYSVRCGSLVIILSK